MEQGEFIALVEEILEVDAGTVSMTDRLEAIDWDSLSNISFIAEIDDRLNVSMEADRLAASSSVGDLYALVQNSLNGA